jgi:uncharacterized membrane protein
MNTIKLYFVAFFTYFGVDVAYQVAFGMRYMERQWASAGIADIKYAEANSLMFVYMLLFFAMIAVANLRLCIVPAIEAKSVKKAMHDGLLLGVTAYGTLGLTCGWTIDGFSPSIVVAFIVEGGAFSLVCSGFTTWFALRKQAT